jgi:hypothetical protein
VPVGERATDATDFPFEHDTELGMNPPPYLFTQPLDIGGVGRPGVD